MMVSSRVASASLSLIGIGIVLPDSLLSSNDIHKAKSCLD
jgi:hypothetical protein